MAIDLLLTKHQSYRLDSVEDLVVTVETGRTNVADEVNKTDLMKLHGFEQLLFGNERSLKSKCFGCRAKQTVGLASSHFWTIMKTSIACSLKIGRERSSPVSFVHERPVSP